MYHLGRTGAVLPPEPYDPTVIGKTVTFFVTGRKKNAFIQGYIRGGIPGVRLTLRRVDVDTDSI